MVSNERTVTPPCDECGHTHALAGCVGPPTSSDLWAGVTPSACDCKRLADAGTTQSAPEPSQAATEAHSDDGRRKSILFNDITHAPTVRHIIFSDRLAIRDYLWAQGWRRDVRPEDVTERRGDA